MAGPGPTTNAELEAVTEALVVVDLVVVGAADAERLAGSRWHVVARGLREGMELHDAS